MIFVNLIFYRNAGNTLHHQNVKFGKTAQKPKKLRELFLGHPILVTIPKYFLSVAPQGHSMHCTLRRLRVSPCLLIGCQKVLSATPAQHIVGSTQFVKWKFLNIAIVGVGR